MFLLLFYIIDLLYCSMYQCISIEAAYSLKESGTTFLVTSLNIGGYYWRIKFGYFTQSKPAIEEFKDFKGSLFSVLAPLTARTRKGRGARVISKVTPRPGHPPLPQFPAGKPQTGRGTSARAHSEIGKEKQEEVRRSNEENHKFQFNATTTITS